MKFVTALFAGLLALASGSLLAQEAIIGASPSSRAALELYTQPGGAPSKTVAVTELPLPLTVIASQSGYHKIEVGGKEAWVKGAQVRIKRSSQASCAGKISQLTTTGSIAGAGGDACK